MSITTLIACTVPIAHALFCSAYLTLHSSFKWTTEIFRLLAMSNVRHKNHRERSQQRIYIKIDFNTNGDTRLNFSSPHTTFSRTVIAVTIHGIRSHCATLTPIRVLRWLRLLKRVRRRASSIWWGLLTVMKKIAYFTSNRKIFWVTSS